MDADGATTDRDGPTRGRRPAGTRVHAAWLLTGGVTQSAVAFGANLVLVRHVGPDGFGRFALDLAGVGLLLSLVSLRTGTRVIRARAASDVLDPTTRDRLANAICQETLLVGIALLVLLQARGGADPLTLALVGAVLVQHLQTNLKAFKERTLAYRQLALLETGTHLAGHGISVALALLGAGAAALYVREAAIALIGLSGLLALRAVPAFRWRWLRPRDWVAHWRDARDVWLDGALESGFARALVLTAGAVGGERGAGLLFQAHRLAMVPHQFLQPVAGRLALTRFARAADPAARAAARRRIMGLLALPLGLAALGACTLADPVVPWLLGERWADAAPLLPALLGVVTGMSLFSVLNMYLLAARAGRVLVGARLLQFVGLAGGAIAAVTLRPEPVVEAVAWGISAAYALAILWTWAGARALEAERGSAGAEPAARRAA